MCGLISNLSSWVLSQNNLLVKSLITICGLYVKVKGRGFKNG